MPRMTDEEADALDELVTKNPPKVSGDRKSGFFMKHKGNIVIFDEVSATWLRSPYLFINLDILWLNKQNCCIRGLYERQVDSCRIQSLFKGY